MIADAKKLIQIGLPIIPICSHDHANVSTKHQAICNKPGKVPLIAGWQTRNDTTEEQLYEWQRQFKTFNVGMPLGEASGYCGIDIDGEFGEVALEEMSDGNIPDTWEFSTGAGRRLLYQLPHGAVTKKFKKADKEEKHSECALLCSGQQTVLPPSIHFTGRKYDWTKGKSPWELDCADAPKWLLDLVLVGAKPEKRSIADEFESEDFSSNLPVEGTQIQGQAKGQKGRTGHQIVVDENMLTSMIPEGQRDNTMTAIIGHYCANKDLRRFGKDFIMDLCQSHNKKFCDPPLEEMVIAQKVVNFYEAEMLKEAKYKESKAEKAPTFEASKMAAVVRAQLREQHILLHFDQNSKMYYYTSPTEGPWQCTRNVTLINKWVRSILISPGFGHPSWDKTSFIEETRKAMEEAYTTAFKSSDDFDLGAHADTLSTHLVVNNGMVDWVSGELLPWNPNFHTTVSFDLDYDKNALCPKFEKHMAEWLPDPDVRAVVQEFLGYCLIPNTKFRKALFLYGKGKNGKSMLLEFLQDFFGENKATLSYDALFQRFGPANLKGKLVNIYDDTSVAFVKDTGIAKNLIAGGTIAAEFKGKDHFTFTNVARFIFSAQETPKTSDHTEAWYDRWIFVKFPNKFRPSNEKKIEIQHDLLEERAGILNWMIEGLRRLMNNDGFTDSVTLDESGRNYKNQNDGVALFTHNMCSISLQSNGIAVNTLFRYFCTWLESEGLRPISKRVFAERLEDLGYEKCKGYVDGKPGQTLIKNMIINKLSEDYMENKLQYVLAEQN